MAISGRSVVKKTFGESAELGDVCYAVRFLLYAIKIGASFLETPCICRPSAAECSVGGYLRS